jgi:hypothetical protein
MSYKFHTYDISLVLFKNSSESLIKSKRILMYGNPEINQESMLQKLTDEIDYEEQVLGLKVLHGEFKELTVFGKDSSIDDDEPEGDEPLKAIA